MTSGDPYADALRRALRAEADQVMPSPDGLGRIRERTSARRPLPWAASGWKGLLLAAAAAVATGTVAVTATPAAYHRFLSPGTETVPEQHPKTAAPTTSGSNGVIGPDGAPTPSPTCLSPYGTPSPSTPSPSLSPCPPSLTTTAVPQPPAPSPSSQVPHPSPAPATPAPSGTPQPSPPAATPDPTPPADTTPTPAPSTAPPTPTATLTPS
ncbi:hypothetical protein LO762_30785 [Actinocorallia sp. API 0066]|uniref:hypothetical protein n=1 Tax=Actinocorallia sp. API 0066 TaxID=2896846 RepID=UPI001E521EA1|nr:hypothetical protein [Actinocorallia sp. API 0066]MCD0453539.1 hypothetical protein [Actinocorallia sp. API 0066]